MIMQFDIEIPYWANWLAQDEDGNWYAYEKKPRESPSNVWLPVNGLEEIVAKSTPPKDWTQELWEIIR